jgi:hypothetical protein
MNNLGTFLFQNDATTTGNGELYLTNKGDIVTLEITGTATSGTVVFEGLMPSGSYYSICGIRLSDYTIANESIALDELWQIDVSGYVAIRARISAIAGGYITVNSKVVNSNG